VCAFRTRAALQLEIIALRHQLGVLQRSVDRPRLNRFDRFLWAWFSAVWDEWRSALCIVRPETVIAWHRKGFRLFWTWKVRRGQRGRPSVSKEVRKLIRKMSRENPLWGAPRIHGELLKLGIDIGETSVSKYMIHRVHPPSQTWRTFLENHLKTTVSIDFFTVPTIRFKVLYVFLVLAHDRRRIVHFNVTAHPTPSGRDSNCERRSRLRRCRDTFYGMGTASSDPASLRRSGIWASKRCSRRRVRPGNGPTSNA
jgi:putative transposase